MSKNNLPRSISDALLKRFQASSSKTAFTFKEPARWREMSWNEVSSRARNIAGALLAQGFKKGDRVAILSNTRVEWALTDFACQLLGLVSVPIYHSNLASEVTYVLKNSAAKAIFVENRDQLEKVKQSWKEVPGLQLAIVIDGSVEEQDFEGHAVVGLHVFEKKKTLTLDEVQKHTDTIAPTDLMTIIYTSGTTGVPKGACIPQSAMISVCISAKRVDLGNEEVSLSFLPFAHVLGRVELYLSVFQGVHVWFAQNLNTIADDLIIARPTVLISVPRIYEKVYSKILATINGGPPVKKKLFDWAVKVGTQYSVAREHKKMPSLKLVFEYHLAKKLVFSKIAQKFGGRLRIAISGGAPLSSEIARFFDACGVLIYEGYGLTETTGPLTLNMPGDYRFGTVGKILCPDVQLKIAEDGEILAKGSCVFVGYYENPQETKEAFTSDGFFKTGDIGEFRDGFLAITDRKKDLIVLSAGKNVAPQFIENLLKLEPLISQALVVGDRQKYIAALVTLDRQKVEDYARQKNLSFSDYQSLLRNPTISNLIQENVKHVNTQLPSYSTIKKFHVLEADFTVESGELTPSLKVKRKVCSQKYQNEIASLFN